MADGGGCVDVYLSRLWLVLCLFRVQEEVDVMEGLTDAQAAKIAKHLKLEGPAFEAVGHSLVHLDSHVL